MGFREREWVCLWEREERGSGERKENVLVAIVVMSGSVHSGNGRDRGLRKNEGF